MSPSWLEGCDARFGDLVILLDAPPADTDRADDAATGFERDAAGEDDQPALVRGVDPEQGLVGLAERCGVLRRHVERTGWVRLVLGDVDRAQPVAVNSGERRQVVAIVEDGVVHRHTDLIRLGTRCIDDCLRGAQGHAVGHGSSFDSLSGTGSTLALGGRYVALRRGLQGGCNPPGPQCEAHARTSASIRRRASAMAGTAELGSSRPAYRFTTAPASPRSRSRSTSRKSALMSASSR